MNSFTTAELQKAYTVKSTARKFAGLEKRKGKFYIGKKEIIPAERVQDFLIAYYDDPATGFSGRDRLHAKIYQSYLGISKEKVAQFLKNNQTAQIHTQAKIVKMSRPLVPTAPNKTFQIDLTWLKKISPDTVTTVEKDSQCVFTCVDCFSKFAFARMLPNKTAVQVAKAIRSVIAENGSPPSVIRTDNGSEFIAKEFQNVCKEFGIKHVTGDSYSPKQQSMIERFNRTLKMAVYKYQSQWNIPKISNEDIQKIMGNYNSCKHGTTKQAPVQLHKNENPEEIKASHGQIKTRAKKLLAANAVNFPKLVTGDSVRVAKRVNGEWRKSRTFKSYSYLSQWFYELFKVAEITQATAVKNSMYKLLGPDGTLIDRWFLRQDLLKVDPKKLIVELERGEYVVEAIVDKSVIEGVTYYLCKFKGYDELEWTEPQASFRTLIKAWETKTAKNKKHTLK